jgi:hypothetical protein
MPTRSTRGSAFVAEDESQAAEEELREQLRALKVADVLVTSVFQISSVGFYKLAEEGRDLEQARLAIEALRVLVPVLADAVPEQVKRDLEQMVANMQLAYAETSSKPEPS